MSDDNLVACRLPPDELHQLKYIAGLEQASLGQTACAILRREIRRLAVERLTKHDAAIRAVRRRSGKLKSLPPSPPSFPEFERAASPSDPSVGGEAGAVSDTKE